MSQDNDERVFDDDIWCEITWAARKYANAQKALRSHNCEKLDCFVQKIGVCGAWDALEAHEKATEEELEKAVVKARDAEVCGKNKLGAS